MRRLALIVALALWCVPLGHAQYVQVTAKLTDGGGSVFRQGFLHFELQNCGQNFPRVSGTNLVPVRTSFDIKSNQADGTVLGQVIGNDQILCGGVKSTFYVVTVMKDATTPLAPVAGQKYSICSATAPGGFPCGNPILGSWDLSTAQPMTTTAPTPGFSWIFQNPIANQTWNQPGGTTAYFFGRFDFTGATVIGLSGGGGGSGDALLHPPSDQIFKPLAGAHQYFDCPDAATGGYICYAFRGPGGVSYWSVSADGTLTAGDGITGTWRAAHFIQSTGTPAQTTVFGCNSTALCLGFRSNLRSGDNTIGQDAGDQLILSNFAAYRDNMGNYFTRNSPLVRCQPIVAQDVGITATSAWMVDASCPFYADAGGDAAKTLKAAINDAISLGNIDVYAGSLKGDLACFSPPLADSYSGTVYLGNSVWWARSNQCMFMLHSRFHVIGHEGRSATGATSGTIIRACNNDNPACNGATYDPLAGNHCVDGAGSPIPCALVTWSQEAELGNPSQQMFATTFENATISCNGISGAVGMSIGMFPLRAQAPACNGKCGPQENGYVKGVRIEDCGNAGTGIRARPGSSNFQFDSLNILNEQVAIADCTNFHAIDLLFDNTIPANGPKRFDNLTNTDGACTTKPLNAFLVDAGETQWKGVHCENMTSECLKVGSRANAIGTTIINANGVGSNSNSAVIRISAGNVVGLTAQNTVNTNVAGYTIKDEYHGEEVRIDCQSDTAFYAFGAGIADRVISDAPCIPQVLTMGPPFITNVALSAGDVLKYAGGSTSYQVTKTGDTTATQKPLGITLAAISDTSVRVPVATYGIVGVAGIPGPILDTAMPDCHIGDYVFYGPTTNGKVQCSATRPANMGILGTALNTVTAGNQVPMLLNPEEPGQPFLTQCTGTGTSASPSVLACTTNYVGAVKCAHASSAGLCEIQFTAGKVLKPTSQITLTGDTTITTGCDPLTAALYVSLRSFAPASACQDNTKDCLQFPVQTLGGTNGLCVGYGITNIVP